MSPQKFVTPIEGLTIGQALASAAVRDPDRQAVVFPLAGVRWTYRQLNEQVEQAARALLALGISRGQHVAVWATNVPEWIVMQFATARVGAVLVTINPAYRPFELQYVLKQSDAVMLVLVDRFKTSDYFAMLGEVCPEIKRSQSGGLKCAAFPRLRHVVGIKGNVPRGATDWKGFLDRARGVDSGELQAREDELHPQDPINIQYTSGTTGFPKAAMLTHRNLLTNAFHVGRCQRIKAEDRICVPVPFYHCFGCVMGVLCAVIHGATVIVPAESFQPEATLDAIEQQRATAIYGVPTMFIAQLQHETFAGRDLSSLRTGIMAGSPCPIEVMRNVIDRMGAKEITIAYGQTEASPVITQTRTDDSINIRVETVGRPLPGVDVKIVDPETGITLDDEVQGELCARGHVVMLGYYHDPKATHKAIDADGWLHTGDLAVRRPDGNYRITGRIKDMVIRGGENIYPREIEEFLFQQGEIEQAAVVGVPDPKFVEELCAWVKLQPGAELTTDQIRQRCRDKLAHYKVPRYVCLVETFPQTVTGKIQKFKIRERMIHDLGLEEAETA